MRDYGYRGSYQAVVRHLNRQLREAEDAGAAARGDAAGGAGAA